MLRYFILYNSRSVGFNFMLIDVSKHALCQKFLSYCMVASKATISNTSFRAKILVQEPTQNFTVEVWSNNGTHWFIFWWNQECPVLPNRRLHRALMKCFSCIKENRCGQSHEKLSCDLLWVPTGQSFLQIWEVAPAESEYSSGTTSPPKARFLDSDLGCCRLHATIFHLVNVLGK